MKRINITALMLLVVATIFAYPVKISSWHVTEDVKRLNALHISVDYVNQATQTIRADVQDDRRFQLLVANGFKAEKLPDLAKEYVSRQQAESTDSRDPLRNYLTFAEYITFMQNTATQYPNLCQLIQYGTTTQNRPMYFLKISDNVSVEENEPEFRYFSSIHGNEVVGYDMCIRLIQQLTSQYGTNTRITDMVNNTEIWICPMTNPDGYVLQQRFNAAGIDINRNFPTPNGVQHPDDEAWAPETQAIMTHSNAHNFNLSGMFHGGELVVNYLWDYTTTVCADNSLVVQGALAYADHNPELHNSTSFTNGITEGAEWYQIDGSLQDWMYGYTDEINYTLEIGDYWPSQSTLDGYWANNQESMLSLLEFVQRGVSGTVTSSSGTPLAATITVANNAKVMHTDANAGDFHRLLLPGTYSLTASAIGYVAQSAQVTVPTSGRITHNFVLAPASTVDFGGSVVNSTGNPVAGATIKLTKDGHTEQIITNAQGKFVLADIYTGEYTLSVTAQGLGGMNQLLALAPDTNHQVIVLTPPFFTENFESGSNNWTLTNPWAVVAHEFGHALTDSPDGNYNDNLTLNATLTNPVSLVNISSPNLTFDIKHFIESGYDFLKVQGSLNGTSWGNLAEFTGTQSTWMNVSIPLTAYANQNFRLRFRMESDYGENADGVYIDNLAISGNNSNVLAYGDINGNHLVNLDDALYTLEYAVGNNPLPALDPIPWATNRIEAADVDNDTSISAVDAFIIADKTLNYNSSFPAQGGAAYNLPNPNVTLQYLNGTVQVLVANPNDLACLQLAFTTSNGLLLNDVEWLMGENQCLTTMNAPSKSIALVNLHDATLNTHLANVDITTSALLIHCEGWVNGIPFSQDISLVGNNDNNGIAYQNELQGNYPNPFNPGTTIHYTVEKDNTPVRITIYNSKGQAVKTLLQANLKSGAYTTVFDGNDSAGNPLGNGIYYVRMHTMNKTSTHKMLMLK